MRSIYAVSVKKICCPSELILPKAKPTVDGISDTSAQRHVDERPQPLTAAVHVVNPVQFSLLAAAHCRPASVYNLKEHSLNYSASHRTAIKRPTQHGNPGCVRLSSSQKPSSGLSSQVCWLCDKQYDDI